MSPDDIINYPSTTHSQKKTQYLIDTEPKDFCNEYQYRNYQNQRLIDFDFIPEEVKRITTNLKIPNPPYQYFTIFYKN